MTSKMQSDDRYWTMSPGAGASQSTGSLAWQWFRIWRWPAGLVAGLVLWLALVAVVGAATRVGGPVFHPMDCRETCRFDLKTYNPFVINIAHAAPLFNANT